MQQTNFDVRAIIISVALLFSACDSSVLKEDTHGVPSDSIPEQTPSVRDALRLSNVGSYNNSWVEITSLGWMRDSRYGQTPSISEKLSLSLQDSLLGLFVDMDDLPVPVPCTALAFISRTNYELEETVEYPFEICRPDESNPTQLRIQEAWNRVWALNADMHQRLDPWIDVDISVEVLGSHNSGLDSLSVSDSIGVALRIENPTDKPRSVYFKRQGMVQVKMSLWDTWGVGICTSNPSDCEIRTVELEPNESTLLVEKVPVSYFIHPWYSLPRGRTIRISPLALELFGNEVEYSFVVTD
jgi:hypothetical protein